MNKLPRGHKTESKKGNKTATGTNIYGTNTTGFLHCVPGLDPLVSEQRADRRRFALIPRAGRRVLGIVLERGSDERADAGKGRATKIRRKISRG